MVYYSSWDEFEKAASALFASAADKARYTIKYCNRDSQLVLKVTDDATSVQMRTQRLDDIKRIASLHRKICQTTSHRTETIKALAPRFPRPEKTEKQRATSEKVSKDANAIGKQTKKKSRGKKRH
ncbi:Signal recognition particle protein [Coemansia brasiliensis]|uniref:Signal recognition particle protein n=1 Tax=Coemansia brasiliensis TaxID=2650707 RepID=A0A9W8I4C4_9FUNG|nr:Signal recognition particle protein [Coemansia brasiliensis]